MPPIRILHLRDTHEIGGPGKTILETNRAIDRDRYRLHLGVFVTRHESGTSPFTVAAGECGLPVHLVRGYNQYDLRLITRVAMFIRRLDIDIVHAHEVKSDVIAMMASYISPVKVMTTLHGWIGNEAKSQKWISFDKRIVSRFDFAIAVSQNICNEMLAVGMPPHKIAVLHNAIVAERYHRSSRRGMLEALCGQALPGPVVVTIGRLSPEKGHHDFINAVAQTMQRGVDVSAVLVGDGPERARLEQMVRSLRLESRVHFVGYVPQADQVLNEADILVLPSHSEGLPNVVLESLLMEVPVLATAVGGTPEVVQDGITGRLVERGRPDLLAAALSDFVRNPKSWQDMARRGKTLVEARFDFDARTRRLERIYDLLMRTSPALQPSGEERMANRPSGGLG